MDLREINEHSSVESYITYFQSRNMGWLKYASGMKEGVCVQNFGDKLVTNFLLADTSEHGCEPSGSERDQE